MNRKIAKKMFFPYRTCHAIIKNVKAVRGAHMAAPPYRLEYTCALLGVITVTHARVIVDMSYQHNKIEISAKAGVWQKHHVFP
jgi:hypothetical protein